MMFQFEGALPKAIKVQEGPNKPGLMSLSIYNIKQVSFLVRRGGRRNLMRRTYNAINDPQWYSVQEGDATMPP